MSSSALTHVTSPADRLRAVRERIERACAAAGRSPDDVRLVAVTKSAGMEELAALYDAGVRDFGESRPQQLVERREAFRTNDGRTPTDLRWHLIGPLQTNKVRRTLPHVALLHSLDRTKLLRAVERSAAEEGVVTDALLQVNVSGEEQKFGFAPADVPDALAAASEADHVRIRGLMCMAPYDAPPGACRTIFRRLRELRDDPLCSRYLDGAELSMGMSGDFEVAVEEGATIVRVGRALFRS